jgi:hypothetical protein
VRLEVNRRIAGPRRLPASAMRWKGLSFAGILAAFVQSLPITLSCSPMATRVFISFDFDHDLDLKTLLAGQAKNPDSPFQIADWSVKEPETGDWKEKIRKRIRQVGQVAVICGKNTGSASGVSAEVEIAREEGKPYFLLAGRSTGTNKKPKSALASDKMYDWTWPNLKTLIAGGR